MSATEDLWHFSGNLYARSGVARHCLHLQDQWSANINVILWLAWLEQRAQQVSAETIFQAETEIAAWHLELTIPLRQLRRYAGKKSAADKSLFGETYRQLKAAELHAEEVEQALLADFTAKLVLAGQSVALTCGANVKIYLDRLKVPQEEQHHLLALLQC